MSEIVVETAFREFLRQCRELHEKWHPQARIDPTRFELMANEEWKNASDCERRPFLEFGQKILSMNGDLAPENLQDVNDFGEFARIHRIKITDANPGISIIKSLELVQELWHEQRKKQQHSGKETE